MDMIHHENPGSISMLLPREQMDLASRLSTSNESFRRLAAHGPLVIQKVPQSVRDSLDERYFVPDVVSIGPFHHRARPHLVQMEEVKEAVAHEFCRKAMNDEAAVSRLHKAVMPILPDAQRCYADADKFDNIKNSQEFAYMMVVDGCFLLAVMAILTRNYPAGLEHSSWTHGRMLRIMKDVLLFENQIPWVVMRELVALCRVDVDGFVDNVLAYFDFDVHNRNRKQHKQRGRCLDDAAVPVPWNELSPSPVHLLDLVHQRHLGLRGPAPEHYCDYARPFAHFTSAVELAEELRSRRILFSTMSDRRTVEFFEGLLDPLPRQELYRRTLEDIVRLRSRRSIRSGVHAVYYRNRRIILAIAPLLSLLVAIVGIVVTNSIKHR